MIKTVIFDMYETLITLWHVNPYMGEQLSLDAGIPEPTFREIWDASDDDRALGIRTFESVIREILEVNHRYSDALFSKLVSKRKASKRESFEHLHPGVLPMLDALKARGVKIGLITNCFSEEKEVIVTSVLYPYFDAVCMSCEEGIKKPDIEIFNRCLKRLDVKPEECLYCGDGGSNELSVAKDLQMKPVQARWYLKEGSGQPVGVMPEFMGVRDPMELLTFLD